jgi:NTE family protein
VALIDGGREPVPGAFDRRMREGLAGIDAEIVDPARLNAMFPGRGLDAPEVTDWLNKLEQAAPLVVYLGGRQASPWARKAIRQADLVVFACRGDAPSGALTEVEAFACEVHPPSARRLVRIHDRRSGAVRGTAAWLVRLPCFMHHHVALEDQVDIDSLIRFLSGRAIGFVAAGGGSFGTAHVGIYKAFRERGVVFDIFVGTSVGPVLRRISRLSISSAARMRSSSGAAASGGRPGRATLYWIIRHSIARLPINTAPTAGSRTAGGRSRRSQPIFRPIILN